MWRVLQMVIVRKLHGILTRYQWVNFSIGLWAVSFRYVWYVFLMGQWLCCCSSMGQDGSVELEMAWIGPAVVDLQCLQKYGCPTGMPSLDWPAKLLHIYRSRRFHRTSNGVNWSSSFRFWSYSTRKVRMDRWADGKTSARKDGWTETYFIVPPTFLQKAWEQKTCKDATEWLKLIDLLEMWQ